MLRLRTILHPTDFSERSAQAFQLACALARDYGAQLVILHVDVPPKSAFPSKNVLASPSPGRSEELRQQIERLKPADPRVRVTHRLAIGSPAEEIVRVAQESKADVIIMGTQGLTGLSRLLLGSVAEQVLRTAPCPVVTMRLPATKKPATRSASKPTARGARARSD